VIEIELRYQGHFPENFQGFLNIILLRGKAYFQERAIFSFIVGITGEPSLGSGKHRFFYNGPSRWEGGKGLPEERILSEIETDLSGGCAFCQNSFGRYVVKMNFFARKSVEKLRRKTIEALEEKRRERRIGMNFTEKGNSLDQGEKKNALLLMKFRGMPVLMAQHCRNLGYDMFFEGGRQISLSRYMKYRYDYQGYQGERKGESHIFPLCEVLNRDLLFHEKAPDPKLNSS